MAFYPDERIAILIDGSNLHSTSKSLDYNIDYSKLLDLFRGKSRLITANYYTALIEHDDYSPIRPLIDWLEYNGFHIVTKKAREYTDRDGRRRIKGNMDIEIVVDMINMSDHIDHIILFSGDGDFRAALREVQRRGTRVTIASTLKSKPPMLSDELRRQADALIDLMDMGALIGRPKPKSSDYEDTDFDEDE